MKFLECAPLDRLNDFLSNLNLGERTIKGCLEAYSCKHAGTDKKLSISLDNEILDYLGKSSDTDSSSPSPGEPLLTRTSRKTLVYLVLALYHMYPDYDFSAVKAHQFFTEDSWDSFKQIFDTYMFEASKEWVETFGGVSLLDALFEALDEVVKLAECEIYGYVPDSEADPLPDRGAIWSFNFLFYNRKLKRIVTFRFSCFSNLIADGFLVDEMHDEYDEEIFADMDIASPSQRHHHLRRTTSSTIILQICLGGASAKLHEIVRAELEHQSKRSISNHHSLSSRPSISVARTHNPQPLTSCGLLSPLAWAAAPPEATSFSPPKQRQRQPPQPNRSTRPTRDLLKPSSQMDDIGPVNITHGLGRIGCFGPESTQSRPMSRPS